MKRTYVKPEISLIAIRPEERLAQCDWTWKVNNPGETCYTNIFAVTSPGSCVVATTPNSLS